MDKSLSIKQAAELVGVSEVTIRRAIKQGKLATKERAKPQSPYLVTREGLAQAGFEVPAEGEASRSELEQLRAELGEARQALQAKEVELSELRGELRGVKGSLEVLAGTMEALTSQVGQALQLRAEAETRQPVISVEPEPVQPAKKFRLFGRG